MCDGNFAKGAATTVGLGQEYDIATNERMGQYEKALMTGKTLTTGLVSNAVSNTGAGSLGESAVNLGSDYAMANMIFNARLSDEKTNKDMLAKTLGGLSVKEWTDLRDSLDKNNDGIVDQKEFNDACAQLDKNNDGVFNQDDVTALGGRNIALNMLKNNDSGRA